MVNWKTQKSKPFNEGTPGYLSSRTTDTTPFSIMEDGQKHKKYALSLIKGNQFG